MATATMLWWQWSTKSRSRTDLIMASSFGVSGVVTALVGEGRLLVAVSTRRVDFIFDGFKLLFYFGLFCSSVLWATTQLGSTAGRPVLHTCTLTSCTPQLPSPSTQMRIDRRRAFKSEPYVSYVPDQSASASSHVEPAALSSSSIDQ